jgi:hypothetical protein
MQRTIGPTRGRLPAAFLTRLVGRGMLSAAGDEEEQRRSDPVTWCGEFVRLQQLPRP